MLIMLLHRSETCMLHISQICELGNFSWNHLSFLLQCDAEVKKWQADQWERPALYWLSFIRRFEVFWSINKEGLAVLIYTSSSQNCQSISYTVLQKYPEGWIRISWELFWPLDGKKKKKKEGKCKLVCIDILCHGAEELYWLNDGAERKDNSVHWYNKL